MASFRARRASAIERTDLYQGITDRIIIQLEQGRVPWVQPWDSAAAALDLPVNASRHRVCYLACRISARPHKLDRSWLLVC